MSFSWDDSRAAFADAAGWFVRTVALAGDLWDRPGLGEWDVRALVGHTSRALVTVETYLARPAPSAELASAADYIRATRALAAGPATVVRGRDAGTALGSDPAAAVAQIAARVLALVATQINKAGEVSASVMEVGLQARVAAEPWPWQRWWRRASIRSRRRSYVR